MDLPDRFTELFRDATNKITILGSNGLIPHLESSAPFFRDLLTLNTKLTLTILTESDFENFQQSLCIDHRDSNNRTSYASLSVHRDRISGLRNQDGFMRELQECMQDIPQADSVMSRVSIRQVNTRLPVNVVIVDEEVWCAVTTTTLPNIDSYFPVPDDHPLREDLLELAHSYANKDHFTKFLSDPGDELIQLYDQQGYPRGVFPRAAFYTTDYQRYSIWGFIFNRNGELLLHQRSKITKDGRGLWDKSVGGHVDLRDSSTFITAQRELVEEMFLPEAEYSKYIQADLGDIVHFGEWNPHKRPERTFRTAFAGLGPSDWVMFRASDDNSEPLTVTRISDRRMHDKAGNVSVKRTVFRSDVFLFVAPRDYLDTPEQMKKLVGPAEASGAAQDHRVVDIGTLRDWIQEQEGEGNSREVFTDDLLHVNLAHRGMLETFSEFVRYISR